LLAHYFVVFFKNVSFHQSHKTEVPEVRNRYQSNPNNTDCTDSPA